MRLAFVLAALLMVGCASKSADTACHVIGPNGTPLATEAPCPSTAQASGVGPANARFEPAYLRR